jgi:peptidoglycan/LPS O-acetylase OafA/YrhL
MSYAIYVVHFPILSALEQFHPGRHGLLKSAIVCVSTVLLAYLLEEQMQPLVNRWSKRFLIGPRLSVPAPALQSSQNQKIALGSAPIAR